MFAIGVLGFVIVDYIRKPTELGNILLLGGSQTATAVSANLSTASTFSVLAALSASSANTTTVSGNLGLSPGLEVSRTGPWVVSGTEYFGASSAAFDAQANALTAFNNLAGQTSDGTWSLNAAPLPGVWTTASSATFPGPTLTLTGGYDDVWIFQIGADFTFTGNIVMAGNAQPCNVFWQVGGDATIASGSAFKGTLIASGNITIVSGATVDGRIISLNGALTTDNNTITGPTCASAPTSTLHVIKLVVNSSSGTAVASDFLLHVKLSGSEVSTSPQTGLGGLGTSYTLLTGSTYVVSEDANASYTKTFSGACDSSGSVTLSAGDNICTITNTDIPPPAAVSSGSSSGSSSSSSSSSSSGGGSGGGSSGYAPVIGILKVPNPLALPAGSGSVIYNYTVWNVGKQKALTDVTVVDDKCNPITLLSGDINSDSKLDIDENWKYSCTMTLATTTVNTVVATGYSDDPYHLPAIATAVATVVVGKSINPPLINVVKIPSRLTPFPFGGGNVTYTYTITNPGVVALNDVTITDDKCKIASTHTGDTNKNNLLEPSETWIYTCNVDISLSTRNIATATGKANGFTAIGYAFATVLVSDPNLPNTGFPPN